MSQSATFYLGDILDGELLTRLFSNHEIQAVIYFAGLKAVGESNEVHLTYYRINFATTINVLEVMAVHNVKFFLVLLRLFIVILILFRLMRVSLLQLRMLMAALN